LLNPLGQAAGTPPTETHKAALQEALALIPADASVAVSAQSGLLPRLSQRAHAHEFPGYLSKADWVIVDQYGFRSSQSLADGYNASLTIVRQSETPVFAKDGVEVYRRTR